MPLSGAAARCLCRRHNIEAETLSRHGVMRRNVANKPFQIA
jgi:hypothetical protein